MRKGWKALGRGYGGRNKHFGLEQIADFGTQMNFSFFSVTSGAKYLFLSLFLLSLPCTADVKTAKSYFLKWQFEKAQIAYEEELKKTNNPEILFSLVICYQKQGRLSSFKNIKTDYPELRNALFFFCKGEYKDAFNAFSMDKTPYSYIGMGMIKKAQGDFNAAEKLFLKAKPLSLAYKNLADLYLLLGKEKSFLKILKEGIKKTNDNELLLRFAIKLNDKKMFNEALNILKMLEKNEPDNILIKEEMLKTLMRLGKEEEEIFSEIIASEIDKIYLKGCFSAFNQRYHRAYLKFNECYEKQPNFLISKRNLLWMVKELKWKRKADELYKEISFSLPGDGLCDVYLAEVYTEIGSLNSGFKYARNALKKEPNLERAHFALGNLYYLKSDFIRAILSYKNGINLSESQKYFYFFLEDAFTLRYAPLFSLFYIALFLITLTLLFLTHFVGRFIIRGYPGLKRYLVRKKWLIPIYLITGIIFFIAIFIGEEMIKFVPIMVLKEIFIILMGYLFITVIVPIILILTIGTLIKWPKLKIYLTFFLLDNSLDVTIVLGFSALLPIFIQYPSIYDTFSFSFIILRRIGLVTILLSMFLFYLWFNRFVLIGYKMAEKGDLNGALARFQKALSSISFIKWLEPTYSDMASFCILGKVFILLKKNEFERIEEQWTPLIKSLEDWWPLNIRTKFLYDWSIILSLIMQEKKDIAKERLKAISLIPEYNKKLSNLSFLFSLLEEKPLEEKKLEKHLSFIICYLKEKNFTT